MGALRRQFRARDRHETFGASAPLKELQKKFGFEPDNRGGGSEAELLGPGIICGPL
jgi:hypothetical protein